MTKPVLWYMGSRIQHRPGSFRDYYAKVYTFLQFPVDRFGLLKDIDPDPIPTINVVPPAEYSLENLTTDWQDRYFNICDRMADNIFSAVGNRDIVIFYSGGIDSTAALVAIMRHREYNNFVNEGRIKVALTSQSIVEYPEFFYENILSNLPIVPADFDSLVADPNNFIITGDGGDYVIGNTDVPIWDHEGTMDNLYKPKEILYPYLNNIEPSGKFTHFLKEIEKRAPFDIVSVNQSYWWLAQCFTHQGEMCYPYAWSSVEDLSDLTGFNKVYRFFLHPEFMTFGFEYMSTNPYYVRLADCRRYTKEYIVRHTGHSYYLAKEKIFSQRLSIRRWHKTVVYADLTHDNKLTKVMS